jgi:hypothetical protein
LLVLFEGRYIEDLPSGNAEESWHLGSFAL